jgi:hypothetical protein
MDPSIEWERARALNRARWDALAALHGQDTYYDTEALVAGRDTLKPEEDEAVRASVPSLRGLDVLHVQCHIGFDTISLARRGARVTGLDFSAVSLAKAAAIAARCGVEIEQEMLGSARPLTFDMPNANDRGYLFEGLGSYAVPDAEPTGPEVCYAHSLGEIVSAAAAAGLRIDELNEHLRSSFEHRDEIPLREDDGWWRLRADGFPLPLLFTLRATRPAATP